MISNSLPGWVCTPNSKLWHCRPAGALCISITYLNAKQWSVPSGGEPRRIRILISLLFLLLLWVSILVTSHSASRRTVSSCCKIIHYLLHLCLTARSSTTTHHTAFWSNCWALSGRESTNPSIRSIWLILRSINGIQRNFVYPLLSLFLENSNFCEDNLSLWLWFKKKSISNNTITIMNYELLKPT